MEAKAYLKYLRIAPRKVQIVADLIRGKDVGTAMAILMQTPKAASEPMIKLLKSAVANAENNNNIPGVRHPRPHPQAGDAPGPGPRLPDQQEDVSRDPGGRGEGIREETVYGTES